VHDTLAKNKAGARAMTHKDLEQRLAAMVAFQCALLALRGVPAKLPRRCYGRRSGGSGRDIRVPSSVVRRWAGGRVLPSACMPGKRVGAPGAACGDCGGFSYSSDADLICRFRSRVALRERFSSTQGGVSSDRREQLGILASEAAAMIAERRFRRRNEEALRQAKWQAESANRARVCCWPI